MLRERESQSSGVSSCVCSRLTGPVGVDVAHVDPTRSLDNPLLHSWAMKPVRGASPPLSPRRHGLCHSCHRWRRPGWQLGEFESGVVGRFKLVADRSMPFQRKLAWLLGFTQQRGPDVVREIVDLDRTALVIGLGRGIGGHRRGHETVGLLIS